MSKSERTLAFISPLGNGRFRATMAGGSLALGKKHALKVLQISLGVPLELLEGPKVEAQEKRECKQVDQNTKNERSYGNRVHVIILLSSAAIAAAY
jgi:hypothetical protein